MTDMLIALLFSTDNKFDVGQKVQEKSGKCLLLLWQKWYMVHGDAAVFSLSTMVSWQLC